MMLLTAGLLLGSFLVASGQTTDQHDKVVGCYWGAWSFYRDGEGKYDVDDFDASLCTHGYYGFSDLSNQTWEMVPYDPWYDLAPEDCGPDGGRYCKYDSYRRFVKLADTHPNFKPILSIGGWNSGSARYSEMAADPVKRQTFLDSVVPYLKKFGFHGLDFDWEYPGSREGSHEDIDKEDFSVVVEMLGDLLHKNGLIFTAAMSPGKKTIDKAYDIPRVSKVFDMMNVMCYDYHGWWDNHSFTGVDAPLYGREEEDYPWHPGYYFNVYDTMNYYLQLGAPKDKIVMGVPFYGRGFVLENPEDNGLYCPVKNGIPMGPYTRQDGIWGFQEIQQAFHGDLKADLPDDTGKWTSTVDDCYKAPYAVNGPYWIGYDDVDSIALKAQFVNFLDVRGIFAWSTDTDDFKGTYFNQNYPLLRTINDEFAKGNKLDPSNPKCTGTAPMCDTFDPTTTLPTTTNTPYTTPSRYPCNDDGEVNAYPGDCHKYYMCLDPDGDGVFDVQIFNCGDDVFDPHVSSCVDPGLPGKKNLCD